jgi:hypothetical protein
MSQSAVREYFETHAAANPHLKSRVTLLCMYAMRDEMGLGDLWRGARGLKCPPGGIRGKRPVGDVKLGEGSGLGHRMWEQLY